MSFEFRVLASIMIFNNQNTELAIYLGYALLGAYIEQAAMYANSKLNTARPFVFLFIGDL